MYLKFAKILAMGLGAVVTTGMPSGMIQELPKPQHDIQVVLPYEIQNMDGEWSVQTGPEMKVEKVKPAVVVDYGVFDEARKLGAAPGPSDFKQKEFTPLLVKNADSEKKVQKPLVIPRLRVVITLPRIAASHGQAPQTAAVRDSRDDLVGYSGTVVPMASYSHSYQDFYYAPFYAGLSTEMFTESLNVRTTSNADTGGIPDKPGNPGGPGGIDDGAANVVPEPAGFVAILAGLPGLTILVRRRKR